MTTASLAAPAAYSLSDIEWAFSEWERRIRADRTDFASDEEIAAMTPEECGKDKAAYLSQLLTERVG